MIDTSSKIRIDSRADTAKTWNMRLQYPRQGEQGDMKGWTDSRSDELQNV